MTIKNIKLIPILVTSCVAMHAEKRIADNTTTLPSMQTGAMDPIRAEEWSQMVQRASPGKDDRLTRLQNLEFQAKFNKLSGAVREFAAKYNEGHGQVWPNKEADALRRALDELHNEPALPRHKNAGSR